MILRIGMFAAFYIVMVIAVVMTARDVDSKSGIIKIDTPVVVYENYPEQANCIAEFNYTHPENDMMTNLELALRECR